MSSATTRACDSALHLEGGRDTPEMVTSPNATSSPCACAQRRDMFRSVFGSAKKRGLQRETRPPDGGQRRTRAHSHALTMNADPLPRNREGERSARIARARNRLTLV